MLKFDKNKIIAVSGISLVASILLFKDSEKKIAQRIIAIAKKYIGQQEKPDNIGFKDVNFQRQMSAIGWHSGQEWCAYFVKLVMMQVFKNKHKQDILNRIMNGSSQITFENFKNNRGFWEVTQTPTPGAIINWKVLNSESAVYPKGQGHFGIVYKVKSNSFIAIEGNKGNKVSIVEYSLQDKNKGCLDRNCKLMGFIKIK